jgi:hypothetical protein
MTKKGNGSYKSTHNAPGRFNINEFLIGAAQSIDTTAVAFDSIMIYSRL